MIHKAVRSRRSLAVHWGTFPLADEGWDKPRKDLEKACENGGVDEGEFVAIRHGEGVTGRVEEGCWIGEEDYDENDEEESVEGVGYLLEMDNGRR